MKKVLEKSTGIIFVNSCWWRVPLSNWWKQGYWAQWGITAALVLEGLGWGMLFAHTDTLTCKNPPPKASLTICTTMVGNLRYICISRSNLSTWLAWQHVEKSSSWHTLRSRILLCYSSLKYNNVRQNNNIMYLQPMKYCRKSLLWVHQRSKA